MGRCGGRLHLDNPCPLRSEHLDRISGLGAVVNFGVGYDSTDAAEAARRGVVVSNTPDVLTDCVADTAIGLIIDVMRGLSAADRFVRGGQWVNGWVPALARRVTGARVGILGLGRIGMAIAHRLEAFDATINYHNRSERDDVSRGSVVDERALVSALEEGRIAGAGLDVFADEPRVPSALLDRDDVVLLPHVGSATVETRTAMTDLALAIVASFLADGTLITPV